MPRPVGVGPVGAEVKIGGGQGGRVVRQQGQGYGRVRGKKVDTETSAWGISLACHLSLLSIVAAFSIVPVAESVTLTLTVPEELEELIELPEEFYFSPNESKEVGSDSLEGTQAAMSAAPLVATVSEVPKAEIEPADVGTIAIGAVDDIPQGLHFNANLAVTGTVGVGTTGARGAIDRITHEILLSLEERRTLVVWLFDQSGSLARQRTEVLKRFDRIYEELGVIAANGSRVFKRLKDKPLLTSVVAFGSRVEWVTEKPTDDIDQIKAAVSDIQQDDSGVEMVFSAVSFTVDKYRGFRRRNPVTGQPLRNVMLVVFTDEAGDDQHLLDATVDSCRQMGMPVYLVGVPAPFGRIATLVKWIDPDPNFDQQPQWSEVSQGPESLLPERVKLHFSGEVDRAIDSGFGPFALTRLCYETGGIYFSVHPNRNQNRPVRPHEVQPFSAHLHTFFDPDVMRKYRPEYVSAKTYLQRVLRSASRTALVEAAKASWISPMENPRLRFVRQNEAQLAADLTEAQKLAAKLEPRINSLFDTLQRGEMDRAGETTPRWQAAYDLAMGRVLAVKVRTEVYNNVLAKAKRGMPFEDQNNNTWQLIPSEDVDSGGHLVPQSVKAREYLQRVAKEHPGTPWAALAERELSLPLGWQWTEDFTESRPQTNNLSMANPNRRPPQNERRNMLPKPKPRRDPPKL